MYWPTVLSVFGYMAAISTIDTAGTGDLHSIGAVYFFIMLYFMVVNMTIISYKMRNWDTTTFTRGSVNSKIVVAGYLSIVWIYCIYGLLTEAKANGDDQYIVIVEWNLVYAGLIWVLCFLGDFSKVYVVLTNRHPLDISIGAEETFQQNFGQ